MRDIWFLITDHKGIVKILAILIAIFCVVSIGVSSYTSTMKVQEQQEQQAKKKEKEKQIKNSSVKLKKDQQKTIDEYDDATAQFSALLSSNVWATYSGTGRTLYFTDSSIIIADPEADPSKVEKPFVIKGLSTEKVDVGEMKNLTRYNCAYDGRVFDIVSYGAVVPCPSKTGPELATVRDVFIAVGHGKTTRRSLICDNGIWSIVSVKK